MPVQCIYTLPVDDPYKKGYVYCTGVVITQKDRVGMALKMYFTDSGKKKESRYGKIKITLYTGREEAI